MLYLLNNRYGFLLDIYYIQLAGFIFEDLSFVLCEYLQTSVETSPCDVYIKNKDQMKREK